MADEPTNGHEKSRLDRIELIVLDLTESHDKLMDSQKHLLCAQGALYEETIKIAKHVNELAADVHELTETQKRTDERLKELAAEVAESHKHTDDRLNALVDIVDGLIRKRPPQAP